MKHVKRLPHQRELYALHRLGLAMDRVIAKRGDVDKARLWARAWGKKAGAYYPQPSP